MKKLTCLLLIISLFPANIASQNLTGSREGNTTVPDIRCRLSKIYDTNTNGNTELVALVSGQTIYVCGFVFFAAGTVNVSLVTGTGTACASAASGTPSTGNTGAAAALTPAFQLTTQTGVWSPLATHSQMFDTGTSNALCLKTSAGVSVQAQVWYQQRLPLPTS